MTSDRPDWDETWLNVAAVVARRALCVRAQVGCALVSSDNRLVSTGYAGPPAGLGLSKSCDWWCPRQQSGDTGPDYGKCLTVHAEANALVRADFTQLFYGTAYVTGAVCQDCAKLLANARLERVVMVVRDDEAYRLPGITTEFMNKCGLTVDLVEEAERTNEGDDHS